MPRQLTSDQSPWGRGPEGIPFALVTAVGLDPDHATQVEVGRDHGDDVVVVVTTMHHTMPRAEFEALLERVQTEWQRRVDNPDSRP